VAELFFCCGRSYCTDPYSPYNSMDLAWKSRQFWACFFEDFRFCLLFLGRTEQSVQLTVGTDFEVHGRSYNSTDLAQKIEAEFSGTVLVL
jgi:hypothetical protein